MERQIKAYALVSTRVFILDNPELRARIDPSVVKHLEEVNATVKGTDYVAWGELITPWRAICDAHAGDAEAARAALVHCGNMIGEHATNSFLKILLRMLTPQMFGTKFPSFWGRDIRGAAPAEVQFNGGKEMTITLKDVEGFDHIGPIAEGWIGFTLRTMKVKNLVVSCSPWSLETPGPPEVRIHVQWA